MSTGARSRGAVERQLFEVSARLKTLRAELDIADEQLTHFAQIADETRLRSLVSETPLADREFQEAERHAEAMRRHRADVATEIRELEARQDHLLDQLTAT
jgi:hypothetical protein